MPELQSMPKPAISEQTKKGPCIQLWQSFSPCTLGRVHDPVSSAVHPVQACCCSFRIGKVCIPLDAEVTSCTTTSLPPAAMQTRLVDTGWRFHGARPAAQHASGKSGKQMHAGAATFEELWSGPTYPHQLQSMCPDSSDVIKDDSQLAKIK